MTIHWLWIAISICLGLIGLVGYIYERIGAVRDAIQCPPIGEMIDIDGRKLHMIRKGSGSPTVVMESSSGTSSTLWRTHQDKLAELTAVVTYDRAGLGWSDPVPLPRTLEERATELHTLLVRANIPPPYVLVGFSYSGLLVRLFAHAHRNEVVGIVFVDAGHELVYSPPEVHAQRTSMGFRVLGYLSQLGVMRLFRVDVSTVLRTRPADRMNGAQQPVGVKRIPTAHSYFVGADENASAVRSGSALAGTNTPGFFGDMPIVVITHGIPFPVSSRVSEEKWRAAQHQLVALSINSTLVVAQNSGHIIPMEEPELVLEAIRKVVTAARNNTKLPTESA